MLPEPEVVEPALDRMLTLLLASAAVNVAPEISPLGEPLLMVQNITAVPPKVDHVGKMANQDVVRFVRQGKRVFLEMPNFDYKRNEGQSLSDAVERAQPNLDAVVLALLVQPRDEVLDLRQVAALGDDRDGVVQAVGLDDGLLALGPVGEQAFQLGDHVERLGLLEPDELHIAVGAFGRLVERREDFLHDFEMRRRAGNDERVRARIHGDTAH